MILPQCADLLLVLLLILGFESFEATSLPTLYGSIPTFLFFMPLEVLGVSTDVAMPTLNHPHRANLLQLGLGLGLGLDSIILIKQISSM